MTTFLEFEKKFIANYILLRFTLNNISAAKINFVDLTTLIHKLMCRSIIHKYQRQVI